MKKGRLTNQRIKILNYLKSVENHPNAEMVYNAVKKELPAITLATVYRNLNLLAEHGDILMFKVNNEYNYDGDTCCHQHCICTKCGNVIDSFQKEISDYALKKIKSKDFKAECVCIIFKGKCKKCWG